MLTDQKTTDKTSLEKVIAIRWWSDKLVTFTTTRPSGYAFAAGQYARLGLDGDSGIVWRAYSMTSAPAQETLEFYGVLVPGGMFTTRLKALREGDPILIEKQVFGFMTADRFADGDDLWMLATGTGVGPFISMLRDPYVWERFRNLVLVHCVRHRNEFAYQDELAGYTRKPPFALASPGRLKLMRALTRDNTGDPQLLQGRITTLLENGTLEQAAGLPLTVETSRVMMCGNPDMIEDMRTLLHQRGLRPDRRALRGQFVTENYW